MKTLRFKKTQFRSGVTKLDVFFFFPQFFRNPVSPIDVLFPLVDWLIEGFNKPLCHNRFLWWCRWYTQSPAQSYFYQFGTSLVSPSPTSTPTRHGAAGHRQVISRSWNASPKEVLESLELQPKDPTEYGDGHGKVSWIRLGEKTIWKGLDGLWVYDGLCWSKDFFYGRFGWFMLIQIFFVFVFFSWNESGEFHVGMFQDGSWWHTSRRFSSPTKMGFWSNWICKQEKLYLHMAPKHHVILWFIGITHNPSWNLYRNDDLSGNMEV